MHDYDWLKSRAPCAVEGHNPNCCSTASNTVQRDKFKLYLHLALKAAAKREYPVSISTRYTHAVTVGSLHPLSQENPGMDLKYSSGISCLGGKQKRDYCGGGAEDGSRQDRCQPVNRSYELIPALSCVENLLGITGITQSLPGLTFVLVNCNWTGGFLILHKYGYSLGYQFVFACVITGMKRKLRTGLIPDMMAVGDWSVVVCWILTRGTGIMMDS